MKLQEVLSKSAYARRPLMMRGTRVEKWLVCAKNAFIRDPNKAFAVYVPWGAGTGMAKQQMLDSSMRIMEYINYTDWEAYGTNFVSDQDEPKRYVIVFSKR